MSKDKEKKSYINSISLFLDNNGNLVFSNVGFSKTSIPEQNKQIELLVDDVKKMVLKRTNLINNL